FVHSVYTSPPPTKTSTLSLHDALPIYGTFQSERRFATGFAPDALVTADLNGDGHLDLAVTNGGSPDVSVLLGEPPLVTAPFCRRDRKSTRLNSSHGSISYAVFCLKKKK